MFDDFGFGDELHQWIDSNWRTTAAADTAADDALLNEIIFAPIQEAEPEAA
jgi:hypothetical protein